MKFRQVSKIVGAICILTLFTSLLMIPLTAHAQINDGNNCKVRDTVNAIKLNIRIPGVTYEIGDSHYIKNLGCYIVGIYRYFASIAGILATVMIMYGGIKYVVSLGSQQKITDAKETMVAAMLGLALTLGSYLILYFVNPNLVKFELLTADLVPVEGWCEDYISKGITVDPPLPQRECGVIGTLTSENQLKGYKCVYKGTECEETDQTCEQSAITGEYQCTAGWEGYIFCTNKPFQPCGYIWDADGPARCSGLNAAESELCFAFSTEYGKNIEALDNVDIYYDGEIYNAHIDADGWRTCGLIYKQGLIIKDLIVGKTCEDDTQRCIVLYGGPQDYKAHIYLPGEMIPSHDPDVIGIFTGERCY